MSGDASMTVKKFRLKPLLHATAAVLLAVALRTDAQVQPVAPDAPAKNENAPDGVNIPDSPAASERLEKARIKETQKQWRTAADFYSEVLTQFPARVVPVKIDKSSGLYRYAGVASIIQERIAKWPADGLKVYNNLYRQTANDLLAGARHDDVATLQLIFWNYFATDAGKQAGIRLVDLHLENGDFAAAEWVANRLLEIHPSLGGDYGMVLYRTVFAAHRNNDDILAEKLLAQLKIKSPNETGSIGGRDVSLVDTISAMLATPPAGPTTRPTDADSWPRFGGPGGAGALNVSTAQLGASLNYVEYSPTRYDGLAANQQSANRNLDNRAMTSGQALGVMPAVDGGQLFFQDSRTIYAVDADSGVPLPGWLATYPGEQHGRYRVAANGRVRNEPTTITIASSKVLAVIGQPDRMLTVNENQMVLQQSIPSTVKLVCLDRNTGREQWARTPANLPEAAGNLRTADYDGTPLVVPAELSGKGAGDNAVVGDSVLVIARGGGDQQFDECYLVSLSLKTGQYRWSTYLGNAMRSYDSEYNPESFQAQLALTGGRVVVMTNLGSVASVSPADGHIFWLSSYERDASENQTPNPFGGRVRGFRVNNGNSDDTVSRSGFKPWIRNPVVVNAGKLFILPADAKKLFVFDAGSGEEIKRIPMEYDVTTPDQKADGKKVIDEMTTLLGVRSGSVMLVSDTRLLVLDWAKYSPANSYASIRIKKDFGDDSNPITGRAFLTAELLFVPTHDNLIQFNLRTQKTVATFPKGSFSGGMGPGNILATAQNVIVAGHKRVDVLTDLNLVSAKFEKKIADNPADPQPLLQFAEALYAGGKPELATTRVDAALALVDGPGVVRNEKLRSVVFDRLSDFARRIDKSTQPGSGAGNENETAPVDTFGEHLYSSVQAVADTSLEKALYRINRGRSDHDRHRYADAVALFQQILDDPAMRESVVSEEGTAAAAASEAIADIKSVNKSYYLEIEAKAKAALVAARASTDPESVLSIVTQYPNSEAADDARIVAVQRLEAVNRFDRAIEILRQTYTHTIDPSNKAQVLEAISNDFLAMHQVGPALDRLARAARMSAATNLRTSLRLPDGTELKKPTYADAIRALRDLLGKEETDRLPDLHFSDSSPRVIDPFVPGPPAVIGGITALVHPLREFDRTDQLLTWSMAGLAIYPAGQTTPSMLAPAITDAPTGAAYFSNKWTVWTDKTATQLTDAGKPAWAITPSKIEMIPITVSGEALIDEGSDENSGVVNGNVNFQMRNGRMQPVVQPPPPAVQPQAPVGAGQETIAAVRPGGSRLILTTSHGRVIAVDTGSGQMIWQSRPIDRAADSLLVNPSFTVVRLDDAGGSQMVVYDTRTGRVLGRRRFSPANTVGQLVNVALSEEGTLVWTLYGRVMIKDLYDTWKDAPAELASKTNTDAAPYVGLSQPDQLIVNGGRVAALYSSNGATCRIFDLANRAAEPQAPLNRRSDNPNVTLRFVGDRIYTIASAGISQLNLLNMVDAYQLSDADPHAKIRAAFIGKDYLVTIYDPVDRGPIGSMLATLCGYSRALVGTDQIESHSMLHMQKIKSDSGIIDYAALNGSFYYLTKDGDLHMKRGARP